MFSIVSSLYREEELQLQKLKKRKIKADPRLSFADDFENSTEEDEENSEYYHFYPFALFISAAGVL